MYDFTFSSVESGHFLFGRIEAIWLGQIYHMINNDSIAGHTAKNNHRSRDSKEPIGNAFLAIHINEV